MKKLNVVISSKAQSDISECVSFVLNVSKEAAINLANQIFDSIKSLELFPERNPTFNMPKQIPFTVRKHIVNARYIILYSCDNDIIIIYRVLDARRDFNSLI